MRFVQYIKCKLQERRAKKNQENPVDKAARKTADATVWMAILTAVIAGIGIAQYFVFSKQLREMESTGKQTDKLIDANIKLSAIAEKTFIASQRAWVGTRNATISKQPKIGEQATISIGWDNVGHEPALNFKPTFDFAVSSVDPEIVTEATDVETDYIKRCMDSTLSSSGQALYPTPPGEQYVIQIPVASGVYNDISNKQTLFFKGCFSYKTLGEVHHGTFCYYYTPGTTKISHLNICHTVPYAD